MYNSIKDTLEHVVNVDKCIQKVIDNLRKRADVHDASKFEEPEKSMYDEFTPKLRELTYGSEEYKECLKQMGVALQHHYEHNSHHPEHYEWGISDMTLMDIIEMFCDWKAASMRHADGNMSKSISVNKERFGVEDQLYNIFQNTLKELDW